MEWYSHVKHDVSESEVTLLIYELASTEVEESLAETIRRLSAIRRWKRVIVIGEMEMSRIMRRRYSQSIIELRSVIAESSFDEVFISRDYCGAGSPLIVNVYPDATRILFGDAFGIIGDESDLLIPWSWSMRAVRINLRAFVRKVLFGGPKRFYFDAAVLTLPIDYSGSYLQNIPLLVPNSDFALAILKECSDQLSELNSYSNRLLEGSRNPHLFLLSTLSSCGFMSAENEIDFYVKIIREITPEGATVLLKAHPRCEAHILASILKEVGSEYFIKVIDDPQFSRFPIELWNKLIMKCRIVAIFSTSCVNLNYFYGKEVILPLNESIISQYVYPESISFVTKGNAINLESLNRLKEWDGNSFLYRAPEGRSH
jgi:hypothetical protein